MPSSTGQLDLKSWSDFMPQERANDHEFNLLLFKFKSLFNEVREYQKSHNDCSVTRASDDNSSKNNASPNNKSNPSSKSNNDRSSTSNEDQDKSSPSNPPRVEGGQSVISLRKKFFQQQQDPGLPPLPKDKFRAVNSMTSQQPNSLRRSCDVPNNVDDSGKLNHYSSSHNLTSSTSVDIVNDKKLISNHPVIMEREQTNSRLLSLSKSSERLDFANNNHITLTASASSGPKDKPILHLERQRPIGSLSHISPILKRDSRDLREDDTIYDAVSPDDLCQLSNSSGDQLPPVPIVPVTDHKSKLETSRSSLLLNNHKNSNVNVRLPLRNEVSASRVHPPSLFGDESQQLQDNTFSSSIMLEASSNSSKSNNNNSSLSLVPDSSFRNQEYGNYVNIDFFLKRSQSPSFDDGLDDDSSDAEHNVDEDDDDDDEDTTHMSHSISTDQICEDLKQLSPRELAKKLSIVNREHHQESSASITPASSGDFLDEARSPTMTIQNQLASTASTFSRHFDNFGPNKLNSFQSPQHNHSANNNHYDHKSPTAANNTIDNTSARSSTTPRDSCGSRTSLITNNPQLTLGHRGLDMIQENHPHQYHSLHKTQTIPSRQHVLSSGLDSNQHLDQLISQQSFSDKSNSSALAEAQSTMRSFLSDLNLSPVDELFEDKAQRRIVKESFAVEYCGRRKLRHLFLFNDVIVCAKYQASSKQKFTFDVKWYLNLNGVTVSDINEASNHIKLDTEAIENQILAIRTNLMLLRGRMQQIKRSKDKKPSKIIKKLKKKRTELEAELVLLLPHLPLAIKHMNGKKFLFFLSSNFDRNQWIESIKYLQSQLSPGKSSSSTPSSSELQAWIQTCRKNLNPSLGTFLLRSNCDDDLLYGDLYINLDTIKGIPKPGHYYFCFEVDSYGHFSQKASSVVLRIDETNIHELNDEYIFPLDGAHTLRILLYEDQGQNLKPSVVGKAHVELSRAWCLDKPVDRFIEFNSSCGLSARLSYSNSELLSMRIPHAKLCPTFGLDITQVCKKEKTQVPLLIQLCVHEVERRGMREVGIYRMSGTSTDIQRLKRAFETNPFVAELLMRDIDINSVTGFLKQYLREMPEGLFINKLYPKFVAAFNLPQSEGTERTKKMLELFHKIPTTNQHTIAYLVEHLVKLNKYESYNKMSLTNLATVLGPNILRPPTDSSSGDTADPFTAVVIGSMSQAGILYFFLNRRYLDLPLAEIDSSELSGTSKA